MRTDADRQYHREYMREWNKRHPEARRRRNLAQYGLTEVDFELMWDEQGGRCAICKKPMEGPKNCHVDHDHRTGKTRRLLCAHCNHGLGKFDDDPELLRAAAAYLEEHAA